MIESDCTVPGFAVGDAVYIRGRVVGFCRCPWGYGVQIAAVAIDAKGNPVGEHDRVYFVSPDQAVNAATIKQEARPNAAATKD